MQMLPFQENAVLGKGGLVETFKKLWQTGARNLDITFKSPTGSGKTFMVLNFLRELQNDPEFDSDVAFVWITFSDELAMQSRDKFQDYFFPNVGRPLLIVADFSEGILPKDSLLFLNWQKLVSKKAESRLLRRPEESAKRKEQGFYFEDVVENTKKAHREIVMIIDESHKNVTASAERDVIIPLDPRIILKVSATPEEIPNASDVQNFRAGFVEVRRADVVLAGLIKERIVSQTEEDLKSAEGEDLDFALLRLAKEKREFLAEEWRRLGENINPLVLIQLPDDDQKSREQGIESKEEIVTKFLKNRCQIPENKIAYWFDKKKLNLENIEKPDSPIEFMLFKYAAGTGWDCPRAHVIVMFREIESPTFKTQTLGRILRNPLPKRNLADFPELREGFLYTNYRKNEIADIPETEENKPKTELTNLSLQHLGGFATKDAAHDIVREICERKISVAGDSAKLGDEVEQALQESLRQVVPEFFERESLSAAEPKALYDAFDGEDSAAAVQKSERLLEIASAKVKKVLEKTLGTPAANLAAEIVAKTSKNFAEALIEKRPAAFLVDPLLKSDFISRADYGDIGKASEFQRAFVQSMNRYFGIDEMNAFRNPFLQAGALEKFGIDMTATLSDHVVVDASFAETNDLGKNAEHEMSDNEVERLFMNACYKLLEEQTEPDTKYGNVARSWGPFKEALRQWFDRYSMTSIDTVGRYKIFLKDLRKDFASKFRLAITQALKDYRPIRDAFIADRRGREIRESEPFKIKTSYAYSNDYGDFSPSKKSLLQPFKLKQKYSGRKNETAFIEFLENLPSVEWWFKTERRRKGFLRDPLFQYIGKVRTAFLSGLDRKIRRRKNRNLRHQRRMDGEKSRRPRRSSGEKTARAKRNGRQRKILRRALRSRKRNLVL